MSVFVLKKRQILHKIPQNVSNSTDFDSLSLLGMVFLHLDSWTPGYRLKGEFSVRRALVEKRRCGGKETAYYLLIRERSHREGPYGVYVEREGESASVADITGSQRAILTLMEALIRGGVTPVGLKDVVEDWLLA